MSLRLTSEAQAEEILNMWFSTPPGSKQFDVSNVANVTKIERKYSQLNQRK